MVLLFFFMLALAVCSKRTIPAAKEALWLCAQNIIPSLFPFFVLSNMLIKTGFSTIAGRFLSPFMRTVFNVRGEGGVAFFIGIISGYPTGAKIVYDLYKKGELEKSEAERLLPYCNNSGPLFIIGAVGAGMLGSVDAGIFLYVIHIISAILTGFILRFYKKTELKERILCTKEDKRLSAFKAFPQSIKDSINSILAVCGFVVFFAAVMAPFSAIFQESYLGSISKGILEVTVGIKEIAKSCEFLKTIPIISGLLGFGGVSVMVQVMGIVKEANLSIKPYIFGKIHQGIISAFICSFVLKKTAVVSTFKADSLVNFETGNIGATVTAVFVICIFYFSVLALRKNFKKY